MARWTTEQADSLRAAILSAAKGERVQAMTFGDQTFNFTPVDIDKARALLSAMEADLRSSKGSMRLGSFSKGA